MQVDCTAVRHTQGDKKQTRELAWHLFNAILTTVVRPVLSFPPKTVHWMWSRHSQSWFQVESKSGSKASEREEKICKWDSKGPETSGGTGSLHQRATLICTEQSHCKWSEEERGGDVRDSAKDEGKQWGWVGGGRDRETEVRGDQCFILKVKVTEWKRSRGARGEYKADWRQGRINVVACLRALLPSRGFPANVS